MDLAYEDRRESEFDELHQAIDRCIRGDAVVPQDKYCWLTFLTEAECSILKVDMLSVPGDLDKIWAAVRWWKSNAEQEMVRSADMFVDQSIAINVQDRMQCHEASVVVDFGTEEAACVANLHGFGQNETEARQNLRILMLSLAAKLNELLEG